MYNIHSELKKYYFDKVILPESERIKMRERRDTNRARLNSGLSNLNFPAVERNVIQGSYSMRTMIQKRNNNYDIDDGAVFTKDSLKGEKGGDMSSVAARQMVAQSLKDSRFSKEPQVLPNCVRVYYNEGYHIDVPVYRVEGDILELAGSSWRESDPEEISNWFNSIVKQKSPADDPHQMRRIVCLLKNWACSRDSWVLPNGLIFSAYCDMLYQAKQNRDDESLVTVLEAIHNRLKMGIYTVQYRITGEDFAKGRENKIQNLKMQLDDKLPALTKVLNNASCKKNEALKAWSTFFKDDYFLSFLEDEDPDEGGFSSILAGDVPSTEVIKDGQDRYA